MELSVENFDGSRTEEDSDDQRDRDISELDIEHAADQGDIWSFATLHSGHAIDNISLFFVNMFIGLVNSSNSALLRFPYSPHSIFRESFW